MSEAKGVREEFQEYVLTTAGLESLASPTMERIERAFLAGWEAMAREHRRVIRDLTREHNRDLRDAAIDGQQDAYREMRGEPYGTY